MVHVSNFGANREREHTTDIQKELRAAIGQQATQHHRVVDERLRRSGKSKTTLAAVIRLGRAGLTVEYNR